MSTRRPAGSWAPCSRGPCSCSVPRRPPRRCRRSRSATSPRFALPDLSGQVFDSSSLAGSPAAVVFWSSWSPRSADVLNDFKQLHGEFGAKGLRVVAVGVDGENLPSDRVREVREFAAKLELPFRSSWTGSWRPSPPGASWPTRRWSSSTPPGRWLMPWAATPARPRRGPRQHPQAPGAVDGAGEADDQPGRVPPKGGRSSTTTWGSSCSSGTDRQGPGLLHPGRRAGPGLGGAGGHGRPGRLPPGDLAAGESLLGRSTPRRSTAPTSAS